MAKIESKEVTINEKSSTISQFLGNLNNLQKLMPEDKISDWESDEDSCRFQIKGLAKIGMRKSSEDSSKVVMESEGKNPFDFTLTINLDEKGDDTTAKILFDGKMNPFMKAMVEKPLTNFFNMLVDKLAANHG
jgi:carbon monoxide dehydrogenase subunit G